MRLRSYLLLSAALPALCMASSIHAQIFELSGGASTLYGAQGGSVIIHSTEMETSIGAGLLGHHFAAGGAAIHRIKDGSIVAGQQECSMDLPTDVFDTSHIFFGTGVGLHESLAAAHSLNAFAGLTSAEAGTPLFQSVDVGRLSAFTQWKRPLGASCSFLATVVLADSDSVIHSVQCSAGPKIAFAATAGVGNRARYEAVSARIEQRRFDLRASYVDHGSNFKRGNSLDQLTPEPVRENISAEYNLTSTLSFSGLHQNYITPYSASSAVALTTSSPAGTKLRSSLDEASLRYGLRQTGLGLTVLDSSSRQGATSWSPAYSGGNFAFFVTVSRGVGPLQLTESLLHSVQRTGESSSILINGIAVAVNSHLRITEAVNVTGSGLTFSHGGTLVTSFSSIEVDYQTLYLPNRPSNPFQQDLVFDTQLRLLRGVWLHAMSSVGPTGKVLYTFRLGTVLAHNASTPEPISAGGLGINVLRGRVVDPDGDPIEGAALMVGPTHLYSDTQGYFFYREKVAHSHPFRVIPEEFTGFGSFVTIRAPSEVMTSSKANAEPVSVVVARSVEGSPKVASVDPNPLKEAMGQP